MSNMGKTLGWTKINDQVPQPDSLIPQYEDEKPFGSNFILIHSAEPSNKAFIENRTTKALCDYLSNELER